MLQFWSQVLCSLSHIFFCQACGWLKWVAGSDIPGQQRQNHSSPRGFPLDQLCLVKFHSYWNYTCQKSYACSSMWIVEALICRTNSLFPLKRGNTIDFRFELIGSNLSSLKYFILNLSYIYLTFLVVTTKNLIVYLASQGV